MEKPTGANTATNYWSVNYNSSQVIGSGSIYFTMDFKNQWVDVKSGLPKPTEVIRFPVAIPEANSVCEGMISTDGVLKIYVYTVATKAFEFSFTYFIIR